jgi:hypothetical protein
MGGSWEDVRAVLLTSTRAIPGAALDAFSDHDAVLVVRDVHPYAAHRRWIADFGDVLVAYRDPIERDADTGLDLFGNVVWCVDRPDGIVVALPSAGLTNACARAHRTALGVVVAQRSGVKDSEGGS